MFTGIINYLGEFKSLKKGNSPELKVKIKDLPECKIGDSIAVNGSCLTLVNQDRDIYTFNLSRETLKTTNISEQKVDNILNVEPALRLGDFLGGHFVSGHVDGIVTLKYLRKMSDSYLMTFLFKNKHWSNYLIDKGSVTINGVSLTVAESGTSTFSIYIIPHSYENTNLSNFKIGDKVNVEFDLMAKYIYKQQQNFKLR